MAGHAQLNVHARQSLELMQIQCSLCLLGCSKQQCGIVGLCNNQYAVGLPLVSCSQVSSCIWQGLNVQHAGGSASVEVSDRRIWRSVTGLLGLVDVDGLHS